VDGEYVPIEAEQRAIAAIKGYRNTPSLTRNAPTSWSSVAGHMNARAEEFPPPSGTEWYPMTCRRIFQREQSATPAP
jgi:hypothetical protein